MVDVASLSGVWRPLGLPKQSRTSTGRPAFTQGVEGVEAGDQQFAGDEEADEEEEEEEEEEEYEDDWTEGGSRRRSSAFTKDSMAPSAVSGDSAGRTSRRSSARSSRRASAISASAAEPRREQAKRLSGLLGLDENSPSGSDSEVAAPSGQRAADQILLHPKEPQSESFVREEVHRLEAKMESSSGVNDALDAARLRHKTMLELEPEVEAADVADWPSERARRASALRHATLMDLDEVAEETLGSAPALTTPSVSESSRLGLPIVGALGREFGRSEGDYGGYVDLCRGQRSWASSEPGLTWSRAAGEADPEGGRWMGSVRSSHVESPRANSLLGLPSGLSFAGKEQEGDLTLQGSRPATKAKGRISRGKLPKSFAIDHPISGAGDSGDRESTRAISPGDVVLEERVGGYQWIESVSPAELCDIVPPRFNANAAAVGGLASAMRQKVLLLREQVGALTAYCPGVSESRQLGDRLESAAGLPSNAAGSLPMGRRAQVGPVGLAILHPSPRETEHLSAPGPSADGWSGVDEETRTRISSGLADWVGSPAASSVSLHQAPSRCEDPGSTMLFESHVEGVDGKLP
ncbi:unnamed protein product [Durusdinium trenchii]|uniref:Uncharacterized protein n=1 Tax=Durusdinium trenchii TaxID=1381693 RepID=A0ABP0H5P7_9DINO